MFSEEHEDLLITAVALRNLIQSYKERIDHAGGPLPSLFQRWADNIPRAQRLLEETEARMREIRVNKD